MFSLCQSLVVCEKSQSICDFAVVHVSWVVETDKKYAINIKTLTSGSTINLRTASSVQKWKLHALN